MMGTIILKFLNSKFTRSLITGIVFLFISFSLSIHANAKLNEIKLLQNTNAEVKIKGLISSNPMSVSFNDSPTLKSITIDGTIPNLYVGDSYDLSQLGLLGKDQYDNSYYIPSDQVSWNIESGSNIAAISGKTLKVNSVGNGLITASYQGIKSNSISFTCASRPYLKTLTLSGNIPDLSVGDNYDLSTLILQGSDQYGNTYNISGQSVTWTIVSGNNLVSIKNNTLTALNHGTGQITAVLLGVASNTVDFQIKNYLALQNLKIQGTIPNLYVGDSYNLDQLTVSGTDQNGNPWDITGQPVTWDIASGNNFASLSGSVLKTNAEGNVTVTATVMNVTSSAISVAIKTAPVLKNITLTGTIPDLIVGNSYNLSQLTIKGTDQYGNFYNISNLPVSYSIVSGGNFASISGNNLIAYATDIGKPGLGTIKATVAGISSGTISFKVKNPLVLSSLTITGSIPAIYTGGSFDLSRLTLSGKDQYGDALDVSGKPITWSVVSGGNIISISNNILTANNQGTCIIAATVNGVTSNQISITISSNSGAQRVLHTLLISSAIPTLYVGGSYDLSGLTLYGYDQYGAAYSLSGQQITWSIVSGWNNATISYNILRANYVGSGLITATINGITSNQVSFSIINYPGGNQGALRSLYVSGSVSSMYAGGSFDLSTLALYGYDQYNNLFNLSGLAVTWSLVSGWNSFTLSNNILRSYNTGTGIITATVNGVTSNQISITCSSYYALRTVSLNGTIPSLSVGDSFDLSRLSPVAYDQNGSFYNIAGQQITWAVSSGSNIATVSGSTLRVTGTGTGSIIAYILGVPSNQVGFTVGDALMLKTITLTDTKPAISVGKKYDLSQLNLKGFDQYGNPLNISGMPITWSVRTANGLVGVSGNFLLASGIDSGSITASIQGITSNSIVFNAVKDPQVLTKLNLTGYIPNLSIGKSFNLSSLNIGAVDQYGDPYNLYNDHITWSILSGSDIASVTGNILTIKSDGTITLAASVKGINSNTLTLVIIKDPPVLTTVTISGDIPIIQVGVKFDLSKLNISAKDQYGNAFNINQRLVIWKTSSSLRLALITGKVLMPMGIGNQPITATIAGVTSKPVNITIKNTNVLKTITLSGKIPVIAVGKNFDLSNLTLSGKDQNGKSYNLNGKQIRWEIVTGIKSASISGKILTAKAFGIVKIQATVEGITSSSFDVIIKR